jgi:signal transduction histidine kinase
MSFLMVLALVLAWRGTVRSVALRSSLALAEEKNRNLYEMNLAASGLAHETKNPLNAVRMAAQTLATESPSSPSWQDKIKLIADEVDRLDSRINEWLAFSRPREPKPKRVELAPLFDELRGLISSDADEKKAHVSLDDQNAVAWADREMLRQLLFNLLLNGVQALEDGGCLQLIVEDLKDGNLSLVVEDDGVGVPPEHRDRLFAPYFTTRPNGSGLGLAICRRIALAHGWRLRYEPRAPRGSSFSVDGISVAEEGK